MITLVIRGGLTSSAVRCTSWAESLFVPCPPSYDTRAVFAILSAGFLQSFSARNLRELIRGNRIATRVLSTECCHYSSVCADGSQEFGTIPGQVLPLQPVHQSHRVLAIFLKLQPPRS